MSPWAYDFRSSDSDIEDEEADSNTSPQISGDSSAAFVTSEQPQQPDTQNHSTEQQNQTSKELEELFGLPQEEENVTYKPNPWSIAKINANARAAGGPALGKRDKPTIRTSRFPRNVRTPGFNSVWTRSGFLPRTKAGGGPQLAASHSPEKLNKTFNARVRSVPLRDSISAALRRDMLATPSEPGIGTDVGHPVLAPQRQPRSPTMESFRGEPQNTLASYSTPAKNTPPQDSDRRFSRPEHDAGAYIPSNNPTIPQLNNTFTLDRGYDSTHIPNNTFSHHSAIPSESSSNRQVRVATSNPHDRAISIPVPDYRTNRLISPPELDDISTFGNFQAAGSTCGTLQRERFPADPGFDPSISPVPMLQIGRGHPRDIPAEFEDDLKSVWAPHENRFLDYSYLVQPSRPAAPEPSPILQLIAKFVAPPPPVPNERVTEAEAQSVDSGNYREKSPIFAWYPPSPVPNAASSSRSIEKRDQSRMHANHTPERRNAPDKPSKRSSTPTTLENSTAQWQPITPPSKTPRKIPIAPMERFDPDDKPLWSTLPTPQSAKRTHPSNEVKTARFRLPGSFLGSSPLKNEGTSSNRQLYRPPPLKRTPSRDNSPPASRWKVTRIT